MIDMFPEGIPRPGIIPLHHMMYQEGIRNIVCFQWWGRKTLVDMQLHLLSQDAL